MSIGKCLGKLDDETYVPTCPTDVSVTQINPCFRSKEKFIIVIKTIARKNISINAYFSKLWVTLEFYQNRLFEKALLFLKLNVSSLSKRILFRSFKSIIKMKKYFFGKTWPLHIIYIYIKHNLLSYISKRRNHKII